MSPGADRERCQRRAEHGRGGREANLQGALPDRQQVRRQQHGHVTVDECTQRSSGEHRQRACADTRWQQQPGRPLLHGA